MVTQTTAATEMAEMLNEQFDANAYSFRTSSSGLRLPMDDASHDVLHALEANDWFITDVNKFDEELWFQR